MRKQWIITINSAVRDNGIRYSQLINGLNHSNIIFNRKILADLAIN
jgi:LSU ribosomal protein L20P